MKQIKQITNVSIKYRKAGFLGNSFILRAPIGNNNIISLQGRYNGTT